MLSMKWSCIQDLFADKRIFLFNDLQISEIDCVQLLWIFFPAILPLSPARLHSTNTYLSSLSMLSNRTRLLSDATTVTLKIKLE